MVFTSGGSNNQDSKKVHSGPRTAGFKSTISYRNDLGVPGYTGYIPGNAAIPLEIKNTLRTGKSQDPERVEEDTLNTQPANKQVTEYRQQYKVDKNVYKVPDKTSGGYWFSQSVKQEQTEHPNNIHAESTYQQEVVGSEKTGKQRTDPTVGSSFTVVPYKPGRGRAVTHQSTTAGNDEGRHKKRNTLGYESEYSSWTNHAAVDGPWKLRQYNSTDGTIVQSTIGSVQGSTMSSKKTMVASEDCSADGERYKTIPRAAFPRLDDRSMYSTCHGSYGHDPLTKDAFQPKDITKKSSTLELADGCTPSTQHVPSYGGFIPRSHRNELAIKQAQGNNNRETIAGTMLFSLDQFSRERVQGYSGYKPQAAVNITSVQPARGPATNTTQGAANTDMMARNNTVVDKSLFINGNKGLMSFFTGGGLFVSDNGTADAEMFYQRLRPMMGLPKIQRPSARTQYGASFPPGAM